MCSLVPYKKTDYTEVVNLIPNKLLKCGRSVIERNDILLNDCNGFVSRSHCSFTYLPEENALEIVNKSQVNGTFVGARLQKRLGPDEKYKLRNGEYVSLGGRFMQKKSVSEDMYINPFLFMVIITKKKEEWENAPESVECPICVTYLDNPVVLRCGHLFCSTCINRWNTHSEKPKCPMCREHVDNQIVLPVHYGLQKCIDYLRLGNESETLFQCKICAGPCDVLSVEMRGDSLCGSCGDGAALAQPFVQKIIDAVVECKNKKRKREE